MTTYSYDIANRLTGTTAGAALSYDALGRLYEVTSSGAASTRFQYDGSDLITEYDSNGAVLRRYIHGPGEDEPLVWIEGATTQQNIANRNYLVADHQGSVVAVTNSSGVATQVDTYDEYGIPGAGNTGRFQYTGQAWIPEIDLYHYKARAYSPTLGRFLQTDPVGYGAGMNMYAYVGGDPVNLRDPDGLEPAAGGKSTPSDCSSRQGQTCQPQTVRTVDWGGGWSRVCSGVPYGNGDFATGDCFNVFTEISVSGGGGFAGGGAIRGGVGGSNGGGAATGGTLVDVVDVVAIKSVTVKDLKPSTLFSHYAFGGGAPVCLTSSQFKSLRNSGKDSGRPIPRVGGGFNQLRSYYGTSYENSFGTATIILNENRNPVGFYDFYNFDVNESKRSLKGNVKTAIGAVVGGDNFSISYANGGC